MKSMTRGADLLARSLAAAGTKHLFALSGNHVMPVFDVALDAGLRRIHVPHEAAAASTSARRPPRRIRRMRGDALPATPASGWGPAAPATPTRLARSIPRSL